MELKLGGKDKRTVYLTTYIKGGEGSEFLVRKFSNKRRQYLHKEKCGIGMSRHLKKRENHLHVFYVWPLYLFFSMLTLVTGLWWKSLIKILQN